MKTFYFVVYGNTGSMSVYSNTLFGTYESAEQTAKRAAVGGYNCYVLKVVTHVGRATPPVEVTPLTD